VKWVDPRIIHLTVKFLGEIPDERVSDAQAIITDSCSGVTPFALTCRGVGAFPSPARPQVVWAGVQAPPLLARLVNRLEEEFELLDIPRERREFTPHLTLGRVKSPRGVERLTKVILQMADRPFGECTAKDVVLMKSELSQAGPAYTPLNRVALG
jgi:RNA 2',3'-cyclic 3'-phosphodiesterase